MITEQSRSGRTKYEFRFADHALLDRNSEYTKLFTYVLTPIFSHTRSFARLVRSVCLACLRLLIPAATKA
jgi:hypothetical protein